MVTWKFESKAFQDDWFTGGVVLGIGSDGKSFSKGIISTFRVITRLIMFFFLNFTVWRIRPSQDTIGLQTLIAQGSCLQQRVAGMRGADVVNFVCWVLGLRDGPRPGPGGRRVRSGRQLYVQRVAVASCGATTNGESVNVVCEMRGCMTSMRAPRGYKKEGCLLNPLFVWQIYINPVNIIVTVL